LLGRTTMTRLTVYCAWIFKIREKATTRAQTKRNNSNQVVEWVGQNPFGREPKYVVCLHKIKIKRDGSDGKTCENRWQAIATGEPEARQKGIPVSSPDNGTRTCTRQYNRLCASACPWCSSPAQVGGDSVGWRERWWKMVSQSGMRMTAADEQNMSTAPNPCKCEFKYPSRSFRPRALASAPAKPSVLASATARGTLTLRGTSTMNRLPLQIQFHLQMHLELTLQLHFKLHLQMPLRL
jgi:hypothetical protein